MYLIFKCTDTMTPSSLLFKSQQNQYQSLILLEELGDVVNLQHQCHQLLALTYGTFCVKT